MENLLGRHYISLFLILLFSIRLSSQKATRDKELRYFWMTVISCFLLIVEDQAEMIASQDPNLRFWRTLFSIAGYMLRSTAALGLVLAVLKPKSRHGWVWIPLIVNLLVCCTAFFTDIAFGYDANYEFTRGPLGYVAFIVPLFYLGVILWATYDQYGEYSRAVDRLILIICAAFCLLSALLDSARGGVRLHDAMMISCIFFYIFLRSYDIRRDSLTSLLNRQSLYDDCQNLKKNIHAAATLDMNGLKELNKSEGYQAGDEALKWIGECIQNVCGERVRAYRIGGDEFVMLFLHENEKEIRKTLEKVQQSVEDGGYSIAWGYVMREGKDDPDSMINRSDMKMFEQKAQYYREKQQSLRLEKEEQDNQYAEEATAAVKHLPQPVAVYQFLDHRVRTLAVSDGFCELFGYPNRKQAAYVLDNEMYRELHADDQERYSGAFLRFSDGGKDLDVVYRTREGMASDYRVVHARGKHVHTPSDARLAYVWYMDEGVYIEGEESTGTQINQSLNRALHEESILHAAQFDYLTGLPNLSWFFQLQEAEKARIVGEGRNAVLLYLDLNGMKYFNHRNGLEEGNRLLKAFAEVLSGIFGKENCCHVTSDHFAAGTSEDRAEEQIERLIRETAQMNGGKTLPVRIGAYSSGMEDVPVSSAYDRARMACDAVRKSDVSGVSYYSRELLDAARKQQYLLENIDRAIEERWVKVYYQPIVRAVNEKISDEEALARWIDPVEGFLSPADFIPHLEKAGLIYKLDLCMLDQILEKIRAEQAAGKTSVPHSLNLSRSDFEACDIVEEIRKRVDAAGVGREMISIEITESIVGGNFNFMKEQICRFKDLGFPVWMDDFGSGYSSLDVLRDIPFDLIKFDMSFMRKIDEGESGKIILTDLMKMATSLGVDTICEGVETEEHVHFLQEIGCSKLQGYFFGKPIPLEEISQRHTEFENAQEAPYFETISRVNLYDLGVLASLDENPFHHAFNTLPMGILEVRGDEARFVRSTPSYREFVRRFFGFDLMTMTKEFRKVNSKFMDNVVKTCCAQGSRSFFDERMEDGTVIHSFARLIGVNPSNGNQAVAVAVLSTSEPDETESSYAEIARALAADYYNIYVVNLDTEEYIEYGVSEDGEKRTVEKHGTDFFAGVKRDAETRVLAEDRELFLNWFSKENIVRELDERGIFTVAYHLIGRGYPEYVGLKITRIQGTNRIILGVSLIDPQLKQQEEKNG